jgi:hypothetical protein
MGFATKPDGSRVRICSSDCATKVAGVSTPATDSRDAMIAEAAALDSELARLNAAKRSLAEAGRVLTPGVDTIARDAVRAALDTVLDQIKIASKRRNTIYNVIGF